MNVESRQTKVEGSVYVEVEVTGRWAVSWLTKEWTDDEKRALANRDPEALDALREEAVHRTVASPDDFNDRYITIDLNGARVDAP